VIAAETRRRPLHRFRAQTTILATGAMAAPMRPALRRTRCTATAARMALRAGLPLQDMEFIQFHPTGIYAPAASSPKAARGEGGYSVNSEGERFQGALCALGPRIWRRADVGARGR